jgi:hypothetical protein
VALAGGAVAAVTALSSLAARGFRAADALGDAAERAGVTVESLSRLKFAAEQNDVEFGSLTTAIKRWQVQLSQAASGGKDASESLERLGLKAADLKGLNLETQLARIADQISKLKDPADRTRVAVELFGRSGEQLVPLLSKGGGAIRELTAEADRLGITLDTQTVKGVDRADKALKKLLATVTAFGSRAAGNLALAITGPVDNIGAAEARLSKLQKERQALLSNLGGRVPAAQMDELLASIDQQIAGAREAIEIIKGIEAAYEEATDAGVELGETSSDAMKDLEVNVRATKIEFTGLTGLMREFDESTRTAAENASHNFEALKIKLNEIGASAEVFNKRVGEAIDNALGTDSERNLEIINIRLRKLAEPLTAAQQRVKNFTDAIKDGLSNAAERGKFKFKDLIEFVIAQLANRQLHAMIDRLGAALNRALSGKGASSGGGGFFQGFLSAFFPFLGKMGRAGGGRARAGDIVGEDGPEMLLSGGQVFNRRQLAFAGAGGGPRISISNHNEFNIDGAASPEQVARYVETRLVQRERKQLERINQLMNRNGFGDLR